MADDTRSKLPAWARRKVVRQQANRQYHALHNQESDRSSTQSGQHRCHQQPATQRIAFLDQQRKLQCDDRGSATWLPSRTMAREGPTGASIRVEDKTVPLVQVAPHGSCIVERIISVAIAAWAGHIGEQQIAIRQAYPGPAVRAYSGGTSHTVRRNASVVLAMVYARRRADKSWWRCRRDTLRQAGAHRVPARRL